MQDILTKRAVGVALRRHQHALAAGEAVRAYRARLGIRQDELAARVGLSKSTLSRIELGERTVRPAERPVFARALGVTSRRCGRRSTARSSSSSSSSAAPDAGAGGLAREERGVDGRNHGRPEQAVAAGRVRAVEPARQRRAKRSSRSLSVLDDHRDYWPITPRQVLYRLMGRGQATKDDAERIGDYIVRGRRAGLIPWEAIGDGRTESMVPIVCDDPEAFFAEMRQSASVYRLDRQEGQPVYIEMVVEAAGAVEQVYRTTGDYGVPVYSGSGFVVDHRAARDGAARRAARDADRDPRRRRLRPGRDRHPRARRRRHRGVRRRARRPRASRW